MYFWLHYIFLKAAITCFQKYGITIVYSLCLVLVKALVLEQFKTGWQCD